MKKIFFLSLTLALSVSLFAQEKKNVEFSEGTHDYGTVVQGAENGRIRTVFKFKNISASPIVITDARASCGCTTPNVEKNKLIAPGEYGEIPVTYDSNRVGSFNKQITVTFGIGSETFQELLYIKGVVNAKPEAQPTAALVK
ncbi:MAG: DUF1573 domain-containing protein [Prevotellaceae bacterium]|jgi:hypothetical protein|nr:DUF1573 domain-containing protein [Prevotellaceae bacterium]